MTTPDEIIYDPPQPNAALVVGPDDVLVQERDGYREHLPEQLRNRVLFVAGAEDVAVLRGGAK